MSIEGFGQKQPVPTTHEHARNYIVGGFHSLQSYIPHTLGYIGTSWAGKKVVAFTTGTIGILATIVAKVSRCTQSFAESRLAYRLQQAAPDAFKTVSNAVVARAEDTLSKEEQARHTAVAISSYIPIVSNVVGVAATGHAAVAEGQKWTFRRAKENLIPQMTQLIWYTAPTLLKLMKWTSQKVGEAAEAVEHKAWSVYEHPEAFGEFFVRIADKLYSDAWARSQKFEYIEPGQSAVHLTEKEKEMLKELTDEDIDAVEFLVASTWDPIERQKALSQNDPKIYREKLLEQFKLLSFNERLRMVPGQIAKLPQAQKAELFNFVTRKAPLEAHERTFLAQVRKAASHGNWNKLSRPQQEKLNTLLANGVNRVGRENLVDLLIPPLHRLWALDLDTTVELINLLLDRDDLSGEDRQRLEDMQEIDKKGLKYISKMLEHYLSPAEKVLLYNSILSHEPLSLSKQTVECMLREHVEGNELKEALEVLEKLQVQPEDIPEVHPLGTVSQKQVEKPQAIRSMEDLEKELASHGVTDISYVSKAARNTLGLIPLAICGVLGSPVKLVGAATSLEITKEQFEKIQNIPGFRYALDRSLVTMEKEGGYRLHLAPFLLDCSANLIPQIPGYQGFLSFIADRYGLMPFLKSADTLLVAIPTATGRLVYTTVAELARLARGPILSMNDLHAKVEALVKAKELATQVDASAIAKVEAMNKMATQFSQLGDSIEKYCSDAKSIGDALCSPAVQEFFLTCAAQDKAVDVALKLDKLGITPEEAFTMSKTIRTMLKTGTIPTEIKAEDGTTIIGYTLAPITDAVKETLSFFGSALKKAASTVLGQTIQRGVEAVTAMPIVQDTAAHIATKAAGAWNTVAEGVETFAGLTTRLPPDVLSNVELFFNAAKEYQSAHLFQTAAEDANTYVHILMDSWYGPALLYSSDFMAKVTNALSKYVVPKATFVLKRVEDYARLQLAETELFQASLDKENGLNSLVETGLNNFRSFTAEQMKKSGGEGLRYKAASKLHMATNLGIFMLAPPGGVALTLFGRYVVPELIQSAAGWLRTNGGFISNVGSKVWDAGWAGRDIVSDAITKSLRFVTGSVDPKKVDAFMALNVKEKLHLAQLVNEKVNDEAIRAYAESLQANATLDRSVEKDVVERLLIRFANLPEHEKLRMSPAYYDDLSPTVQDRIIGLVSRYVGLTEVESIDSAVIARKFNSLDDSIREKIDEVSWWEFAQMDEDQQQDLLFKVTQDPDWSDETDFAGRMKLLQETRYLSNQELKRMLKFQSAQDSTRLVFTPSYLHAGPSSKIVHALDLIKRYDITLYGQLLAELRRVDKSPNEQQLIASVADHKEKQAIDAIACALSLLPEYERRDFCDFTVDEFDKSSPEIRKSVVRMLVGQKKIGVDLFTRLESEKSLTEAQRKMVVTAFNSLTVKEKRDFRFATNLHEKLSKKTEETLLKALTAQVAANEVVRHQLHTLDMRKAHLAFTAASEKERKVLRETINAYPALNEELRLGTEKEKVLLAALGRKPFEKVDKAAQVQEASIAKQLTARVTDELDKQIYITILTETNPKSMKDQVQKKAAEIDKAYQNFEKYVNIIRNGLAAAREEQISATDEKLVQLELKIAILQQYLSVYEAGLGHIGALRERFHRFNQLVQSKTLADLSAPDQDQGFIQFYAKNFEKLPDGTSVTPPTKQDLQERRKALTTPTASKGGLTFE